MVMHWKTVSMAKKKLSLVMLRWALPSAHGTPLVQRSTALILRTHRVTGPPSASCYLWEHWSSESEVHPATVMGTLEAPPT